MAGTRDRTIQPLRAAAAAAVTLAVVTGGVTGRSASQPSSERVSEQQHRHHLHRHHHHYYSADDGPIRSISAVPLCKCPSGGPDADPPRLKPNRRRRLRPRTTVAASAVIACRREIQKIYYSISLIAGSPSVHRADLASSFFSITTIIIIIELPIVYYYHRYD